MQQKASKFLIKIEAMGGALMLIMTIIALTISNTPLAYYYDHILETVLTVKYNGHGIKTDLLHWINDGLMTVFFLAVGLEIKREIKEGELNTTEKRVLPGIAAFGGMVVPAAMYLFMNWADPVALQGWGVPIATDIAFAMGIVSLLGERIPPSAKIFLLAIAVFDDIGAILIIAVFYTADISYSSLLLSFFIVMAMFTMNALRVRAIAPYVLLGLVLWVAVLKSGVHATLSGVVLALAIPENDPQNPSRSIAMEMEMALEPWVMFFVLPVFALANAGVSFSGINSSHLLHTIPISIILGLFVGKQIGIFGFTWLAVKSKLAVLPARLRWSTVYGIALLCGIGFTMSLFIGTLAFKGAESHYAMMVRVGVLSGSLLSGLCGTLLLYYTHRSEGSTS